MQKRDSNTFASLQNRSSGSTTCVRDTADVSVGLDRAAIDDTLAGLCDTDLSAIEPRVADAIRYSLTGGGKRLRGLLVAAAYQAVGGAGDCRGLAAAIEVVH